MNRIRQFSMIWSYKNAEGEHYSFKEEKFFQMVSGNIVAAETLVFTKGMTDWLPARQARPEYFGGVAEEAPQDVPRAPVVKIEEAALPPETSAAAGPPQPRPSPPPAPTFTQEAESPDDETEPKSSWSTKPVVIGGVILLVSGWVAFFGGKELIAGFFDREGDDESKSEPTWSIPSPTTKAEAPEPKPTVSPAPAAPPNADPQPEPVAPPPPEPISTLAAAGRSLREMPSKESIIEAADFIFEKADPAERAKLAEPLAQVLRPHLGVDDAKARVSVARAFAFVASREDSQKLEQLARLGSGDSGYALAGMLRVDPLRARTIYQERWSEGGFRSAMDGALKKCGEEDWILPLLEIKNIEIFKHVCQLIGEVGTARSVTAVQRASVGLWPGGGAQKEAKQIAEQTAKRLQAK
ncbi:MAG: hypothetical protein ACI8UO_003291 [Verrucomicrobiales bacterium]|jgi:hypothetical protein